MCVCVCVCVWRNGRFNDSDNLIKIIGKVDKSNTYNRISRNISFFIKKKKELYQTIF